MDVTPTLARTAQGLVLGVALGLAHFGGLWWTLRRLARWRRPRRAVVASFAVRTALVLPAFALVAQHGVGPLLGATLGFLAARLALQAVAARRDGVGCA